MKNNLTKNEGDMTQDSMVDEPISITTEDIGDMRYVVATILNNGKAIKLYRRIEKGIDDETIGLRADVSCMLVRCAGIGNSSERHQFLDLSREYICVPPNPSEGLYAKVESFFSSLTDQNGFQSPLTAKVLSQLKEGKERTSTIIQEMARKGLFNGYFLDEFIELLKQGYFLPDCCIHHVVPLSMEGENYAHNFVLLPGPLHKLLHRLLGDNEWANRTENNDENHLVIPLMSNVVFCKEQLYDYFGKDVVEAAYGTLREEDKQIIEAYRSLLAFKPDATESEQTAFVAKKNAFEVSEETKKYFQDNYGILSSDETPIVFNFIERLTLKENMRDEMRKNITDANNQTGAFFHYLFALQDESAIDGTINELKDILRYLRELLYRNAELVYVTDCVGVDKMVGDVRVETKLIADAFAEMLNDVNAEVKTSTDNLSKILKDVNAEVKTSTDDLSKILKDVNAEVKTSADVLSEIMKGVRVETKASVNTFLRRELGDYYNVVSKIFNPYSKTEQMLTVQEEDAWKDKTDTSETNKEYTPRKLIEKIKKTIAPLKERLKKSFESIGLKVNIDSILERCIIFLQMRATIKQLHGKHRALFNKNLKTASLNEQTLLFYEYYLKTGTNLLKGLGANVSTNTIYKWFQKLAGIQNDDFDVQVKLKGDETIEFVCKTILRNIDFLERIKLANKMVNIISQKKTNIAPEARRNIFELALKWKDLFENNSLKSETCKTFLSKCQSENLLQFDDVDKFYDMINNAWTNHNPASYDMIFPQILSNETTTQAETDKNASQAEETIPEHQTIIGLFREMRDVSEHLFPAKNREALSAETILACDFTYLRKISEDLHKHGFNEPFQMVILLQKVQQHVKWAQQNRNVNNQEQQEDSTVLHPQQLNCPRTRNTGCLSASDSILGLHILSGLASEEANRLANKNKSKSEKEKGTLDIEANASQWEDAPQSSNSTPEQCNEACLIRYEDMILGNSSSIWQSHDLSKKEKIANSPLPTQNLLRDTHIRE